MMDAAGENGGRIVADQAVVGMRGRRAAQGRITVTIVADLRGAVTACNGSMAQGTLAAVDIHDNVRICSGIVAARIAAGGFSYAAVPWEVSCSMAAMAHIRTDLLGMAGGAGHARARCNRRCYCC